MSGPASPSSAVFPPLAITAEQVRRILVGLIRNEGRKVGVQRVVLGRGGGVGLGAVMPVVSLALTQWE